MPSYSNSIETETWHDWKPSHRKMSSDQIARRHAETMKWDAADWLIEQAQSADDPSLYYEAYNKIVELS